jgi:two-component system, LytTR family, sensor histidine kinase AlgZ
MNRRSLKFWAAIVAVNAAAAFLAQFAFGGVTLHTPLARVLTWSFEGFVFSMCCSSLCIVTLPHVAPAIFKRVRSPYSWALVAGLLVLLAAAGSLAAMILFSIVGLTPARTVLRLWLGQPLMTSIITTLLFGLFFTVVEHLRARLDATTIALRTKERDEAEARRLAAEAQLASIESRVQPHFLFNTLNSIAALIPDDPAGAERMTGQLATLLRSSLDQQAMPLVALDEELSIVRNYLEIERMRFGARLRYDIQIDDASPHARVPRLAVQTIVENSVKYAVSPRREGASIAIRAAARNGHVTIAITDDGPGFDPATTVPGHGLALVRERLAMTIGDAATLRIDSRPGASTVAISVPTSATSNQAPATCTNPE